MLKHSTLYRKPMLLVGLLASGMTVCYGQTSTPAPASKPAAKKPATAGAAKTTGTKSAAAPALNTKKDKVSYAIGADLGKKLKASSIEVDPTVLTRALKDTLTGDKSAMTDDEIRATLTDLTKDLQPSSRRQPRKRVTRTGRPARIFWRRTSQKKVVTLSDGLQYKILTGGQRAEADHRRHDRLQLQRDPDRWERV